MAKLTLTDISAGYDTATVSAANNTLVENALENTLSRDGTSPNQMEANIDMNSNYVRNMHDGVNNQDAVTVAQLNGTISGELLSVSVSTLSDVGVGTPTAGNVLVGDGDSWESTTFVASYFDAEASTDGYVLTSDGAGNAAWEAVLTTVLASDINSNGAADGYVLTSDGANGTAWEAIPAGGSVAGADTEIQFNNSGAFGASSKLTWDDHTLNLNASLSGSVSGFSITGTWTTDVPIIELTNSANSETHILRSWDNATGFFELGHRHDLSDEYFYVRTDTTGNLIQLYNSGLCKANNDTTGAGLERILTESDLADVGFTVGSGHTSAWASGSIMQLQSGSSSTINSGATYKFEDNAELTFGTGDDVVIDFDATNFVIAGTGDLNFTGFTDINVDGVPLEAMAVQLAQTTQTLAVADMNTIMEFTGTATLTLPLNATTALPIGVPVVLNVKHATQVLTVTADTSVTLVSAFHPAGGSAASDTVDAGGSAVLYKTAADVWCLSGDISD